MPRNSLKRSPWTRITSPGASSVPASTEPSMIVSAPAALAFAPSPELRIPPPPVSGPPAHHVLAAARGHRLRDVARVADPSVGDQRHSRRRTDERALVDSRDLRN